MYYLRDLEEQMEEYRRQAISAHSPLEARDLDVLEDIQRAEAGNLKRRLATVLVELGLKVDARAALRAANEAA
ncbi:MAG: hypothetical protein AB7P33_10835 [Dehalococcoidia bacterium]